MRRVLLFVFTRLLAVVVVAGGVGVGLGTTEAAAVSSLQFRTWVADPSGADRVGDNRQLNRETIVITNTSSRAIAMAGYRLRDAQNHTYVFPRGFTLKARASVTVHTGRGTNTATNVYWNQRNYIWNNTGDTASLLGRTGTTKLDTCKYRPVRTGTVRC